MNEGLEILGWPPDRRPCPPPEVVHASGTGVLPAELEARVAAHVAQCALCRSLVEALDDPSVGEMLPHERERIRTRVELSRPAVAKVARSRLQRWAAALIVVGAGGALATWALTRPGSPPTLTGIVTTLAGEPLAGVTVSEHMPRPDGSDGMVTSRTAFGAITDAAGHYLIDGVPDSVRAIILRASKPGFFTRGGGVSVRLLPARVDFRLIPWTLTPLDTPVRGVLEATDGPCTGPDLCRSFAVSVPGSALFEASVITPIRERLDLWVETPDGDVYSPRMTAPLRVIIPTTVQGVYQVTVVGPPTEVSSFELIMRAR